MPMVRCFPPFPLVLAFFDRRPGKRALRTARKSHRSYFSPPRSHIDGGGKRYRLIFTRRCSLRDAHYIPMGGYANLVKEHVHHHYSLEAVLQAGRESKHRPCSVLASTLLSTSPAIQ